MILGSIALAAYSFVVCQLLMRAAWSALKATLAVLAVLLSCIKKLPCCFWVRILLSYYDIGGAPAIARRKLLQAFLYSRLMTQVTC